MVVPFFICLSDNFRLKNIVNLIYLNMATKTQPHEIRTELTPQLPLQYVEQQQPLRKSRPLAVTQEKRSGVQTR
jgi:hypothetical protein